jgi:hypothetical protein
MTRACTTERPNPVPPNSLFLDCSNLKKGLNKSLRCSAEMPGPSSSISRIQLVCSCLVETINFPGFA